MQYLERLLSTNMAVLAVISATMLGLGQQDVKLPLLVLVGATAAVVYTDRRKQFVLNHFLANVAALAAVGIALVDFSASDRNLQLLAIANLLVYLQVVVFFQEKNVRIYGQLAMLSLLQIVVAAALNYSILFGLLAVAYLFLSLPTLSLFYFYRELARLNSSAGDDSPAAATHGAAAQPASVREAVRPQRGRWPLLGMQPTFSGADLDRREGLLRNTGLARLLTNMSIATVALTVVLFVLTPRIGRTPWQSGTMEAARIVGYSEEVTLGELGSSVENPETVMRIYFIDERTQTPFRLTGSPLFRGSVVTRYDLKNRRWSQRSEGFGPGVHDLREPPRRAGTLVRQDIRLEPLQETAVFAVWPVYARNANRHLIKYDENRKQLFRPESTKDQQQNFSLWTTGIQNQRQQPLIPAGRGLSGNEIQHLLNVPGGVDGPDPFAGLKRVADEAVANSGVDPNDPFAVAQALEAFMLHRGGFQYSIQSIPQPPPGVDPIENFVTTSRIGHCEYFASALTLMLRHRGIPARVAIGFKGGDWNSLGQYYQVRQLHAHAWVEAYFNHEQLTNEGFDLGPGQFAGWLTLDSTSDTMAAGLNENPGLWAQTRAALDYVQMQWITYVVGLSREQQREHIYQPLNELYAQLRIPGESARGGSQSASTSTAAKIGKWLKKLTGGDWWSWRGLAVAIGIALISGGLAIASWFIGRWAWRKWRRYRRPEQAIAAAAQGAEVPFYKVLENLLARHGYRRRSAQTQREFAASTASTLAQSPERSAAASVPPIVTEAFYAVRFGGRTLDSQQAQAVEQALADLQTRLAEPVAAARPSPSAR